MMNLLSHLKRIVLITPCATALLDCTLAMAQQSQQEIAKEMLSAVCGEFLVSGQSQSVTIKGDAEAKLAGLIGKLADLGVTGAASFETDKYLGVLRSEVGGELKSVRDCRQKVWPDVRDLAIGKLSGAQIIEKSIINNGDNSISIIGDGNHVESK